MADAAGPLRVYYIDRNGPDRGVALDDLCGAGGEVGADQRQVVGGLRVVSDQDDLDCLRAEHAIPKVPQHCG
ncbi:MAG: hypothetical protein ACYDEY_14150 [Acidimicrobiales bacterium]